MRKVVIVLIVLACAAGFAQDGNQPSFDGKQWWDYVKVLADDKMEGRQTGSPGLKRAEEFVVQQAKADGLIAAGTEGFYQSVPLVESQLDEAHSSFVLVRDGKAETLTLGDDLVLSARLEGGEVSAPLVFIGYGLSIPEKQYDDLAQQDLKGKVVVIFNGSPAAMPTELASHYQSTAERWKAGRR